MAIGCILVNQLKQKVLTGTLLLKIVIVSDDGKEKETTDEPEKVLLDIQANKESSNLFICSLFCFVLFKKKPRGTSVGHCDKASAINFGTLVIHTQPSAPQGCQSRVS